VASERNLVRSGLFLGRERRMGGGYGAHHRRDAAPTPEWVLRLAATSLTAATRFDPLERRRESLAALPPSAVSKTQVFA